MAISSSIIPSFSASRSEGLISGAKNFVRGKKGNVGSLIDNISSPITANFINVFGQDKTEKLLQKNVSALRDTLVETFDVARVLTVAIKEISESLKGLSLAGGGGMSPAAAMTTGAIGGAGGTAAVGGTALGLKKIFGKKGTKEVAEEVTEKAVSKVNPKLVKKTVSKTGLVPKLMNFAKKNKWLAPVAIGAGLIGLSGGDANASEQSIQTNFVSEFNSVVDKFEGVIASLKTKKQDVTTVVEEEKKKKHWSDVTPGSEEEKYLIKDGIKSINEGHEQHLKQNAGDYYEFKVPEYIKNDAGEWVPKEPVIQVKPNDLSTKIRNIEVNNNAKPNITVIPSAANNVLNRGQQSKNTSVPTSSGAATDIAFLSSSKSDSFGFLESKMIYNVVG